MAISAKVEKIIREVEDLNDHERDELMRALAWTDDDNLNVEDADDFQSRVQDLPAEQVLSPSFDEVNTAWREVIQRRAREIDEGKVILVDEEEFFRKLRAI